MQSEPDINIEKVAADKLLITLSGVWKLGKSYQEASSLLTELEQQTSINSLSFSALQLQQWDSSLLTLLARLFGICHKNNIEIDCSGLPTGVIKLLELASPENQRNGVPSGTVKAPFLERVANTALDNFYGIQAVLAFIGEITVAFFRMLRAKAVFRRIDLLLTIQETGAQALPIVSLISLLVGMILAFVAAIQLKLFGAQIYVADVVGIGMVRVMGAIMTGIIMSGRTGAAFAAQLGTMQVNEEIDALETLGFSPVEFLVLPRMLALTLMMPLLCIYSDLMGILGGMIVGIGMLDLGVIEYMTETRSTFTLTHFLVGLFHSFVFGILVAACGCLRGLQCERSASAVGYAATSAVVSGIVSIVVATAIITLVCQLIGI